MATRNELRESVISGLVCTAIGIAIIVGTMLAEDDSSFPEGRLPIYLLGGLILSAGSAIALHTTRWADAALEGFITAVLAISSAILLYLTWTGSGWSRGIPFVPGVVNQFIGNALGTIVGLGMGLAAIYRIGTAAYRTCSRLLQKVH